LVPDITLNLTTNEDYFSVPDADFLLTLQQKTKIINLIQDSGSMIATTVVKIVEPIITRYVINVVISIFEGNDPETIKQTIRKRFSDYMLGNKRRDKIPKSDLIAIVEGIDGVDSVSLFFIGQKNEANQIAIKGLTNVSDSQYNETIGLDNFGDILIGRNELVILRGGWSDRNGTFFTDGIVAGKPGPLNVTVASIVPRNFRSGLTTDLKTQLAAQNK
jgi:hypothetical protein